MIIIDKAGLTVYDSLLKSRFIRPLTKVISVPSDCPAVSSGGMSGTGTNTTNAARARCTYLDTSSSPIWLAYFDSADFQIVNGFKYPAQSTSNAVRITHSGNMANSEFVLFERDTANPYVRFSFMKVSGANISSGEMNTVKAAFKIFRLADDGLSIAGAPADAKAVGDRLAAIEGRLSALES